MSLILSVALGLGLLRQFRPVLYLQLTGRAPSREEIYQRPDPIFHHGLVPGARARMLNRETRLDLVDLRINSLGMRDPERAVPKPPGTYRILMLGDSFVAGRNVEAADTVSSVMERTLAAGAPGAVEVVNGGCFSFSPLLEFLFLKHVGLRLEPDLVVLNLDMSDIQDDFLYTLRARFDAAGEPTRVEAGAADKEWPPRDPGAIAEVAEHPELVNDRYFHTRDDALDGFKRRHFDQTWGYIRRVAALSRSAGAKFLLTTYPMGHQVDDTEWGVGRKDYRFEAKTYQGPLFSYLEERSRAEGVPFLSLLEGFRRSQERPLFFARDGHWNAAGHRLAATLIVEELGRRALLPGAPGKPVPETVPLVGVPGVLRQEGRVVLVGPRPTPALLWHKAGVRGATLVRLSATPGFAPVPEKRLTQIQSLFDASDYQGLGVRVDEEAAAAFPPPPAGLLVSGEDYLESCLQDGTVSDLWWVIPGPVLAPQLSRGLQRELARRLGVPSLPELEVREGGFTFRRGKGRVTVTSLAGLSPVSPGALIDVHLDYFASLGGTKAEDPVVVFARVRDLVPDPQLVTVGVEFPSRPLLELRFLGEAFFTAFSGSVFPAEASRMLAAMRQHGAAPAEFESAGGTGGPFEAGKAFSLGVQKFQQQRDEESARLLNRAAELDRGYAVAFLDRARARAGRGDEAQALEDVQRYEKLRPGPTVASTTLRAELLLALGDAAAAEPLAAELARYLPGEQALNLRARALQALGRGEESRVAYLEAATGYPNAESAYRLGWLALRAGDRAEAERWWRETHRLDAGHGRVNYNLGLLLLELGRPGDARPFLEEATRRHADDADAWNALGSAHAALGAQDEARRAFDKALGVDPTHEAAKANRDRLVPPVRR